MISPFQDRCGSRNRLGAVVFALIAFATMPGSLHAQMAVEALEAPRIVVHGPTSHFDLADLGPDFSEAWLADILPTPVASDQMPALMQHVTRVTSGDSDWVRQARITYARTSDGQPRMRRVEQWDSTAWTNAARTTYTYRDHMLDRQHTEVWTDGDWQPDHQLIFERGAEGRIQEVVHRMWRGHRWVKANRLTIHPVDTSRQRAEDGSERLSASSTPQLVHETWAGGVWEPLTRVTFTVAEDGRHVVQHNETWTGATWEASVRLTFLYDGAGYPLEETTEVWTGADWAEGPLHLYDYELDERRIVQHTETWIGSQRIHAEQAEFTYAAPLRAWLLSEAP